MAALNGEMIFTRGELVEVVSLQEGFRGSYYEAIVVSPLMPVKQYIVQYETLVTDEDVAAPLCEIATVAEVRPRPPEVKKKDGGVLETGDLVDVFDNDGWWVGVITGIVGDKCTVYFACTEEEIEYSLDRLRIHIDWNHGRLEWFDPLKRNLTWCW